MVILARSSASFRSIVTALIIIMSTSAWASVTAISLSRRSIGTSTGIIADSSLPAGGTQRRPTNNQRDQQVGTIHRGTPRPRLDNLEHQGIPQGGSGMAAGPARQ